MKGRLERYVTHKVEIPRDRQYLAREHEADYIAKVTFSVKPVEMSGSDWIAGNGHAGENWISGKRMIVGVTREAEVYKLRILGTGP